MKNSIVSSRSHCYLKSELTAISLIALYRAGFSECKFARCKKCFSSVTSNFASSLPVSNKMHSISTGVGKVPCLLLTSFNKIKEFLDLVFHLINVLLCDVKVQLRAELGAPLLSPVLNLCKKPS